MATYIKSLLTFFVLATTFECVPAQTLPPEIMGKIDSLFSQWARTSSPGCAVGIVRNDSLIFSKGYGMANLEYGVPITPATIFHMASVSKQFTAYSILLLERQGKLSLDEDIHKYLTWFPDLKEKITIRNLLNHTSGIRDQWELLAIAGTRLDDVITQTQIIKIFQQRVHTAGRNCQIRERADLAAVHRFGYFQTAWNEAHPFSRRLHGDRAQSILFL
jgi:CubicO group peptidase (beta-lactamase class C family)